VTDEATANETYRAFIDALVEAAPSLTARKVRDGGALAAGAPANDLVSRLSQADRATLAALLDAERSAAVHDVLARLTWWLDTGRIAWSAGGAPMPAGLEGGLHQDFVGRAGGWPWPQQAP
jgi:hypothetical protein